MKEITAYITLVAIIAFVIISVILINNFKTTNKYDSVNYCFRQCNTGYNVSKKELTDCIAECNKILNVK